MPSGPVGRAAIEVEDALASRSATTRSGRASAGVERHAQPGVGRAVCAARDARRRPRSADAARSAPTTTAALASRGIALRPAPPSRLTIRTPGDARSTRARTLIAFARPSAMSPPECPPSPPLTATRSGVPSAGSRGARERDDRVRAAGAADGQRRVLLAVEVEQDAAGDQRGVEARTRRPCPPPRRRSSAARAARAAPRDRSASAIIAAIATPLSAPSVVPSARSQPSSRTTSIRPARGSFGLSGSRSQTMSRWPWRITVGARSRPGVAGTATTRLPAASRRVAKPCSAAHASTCATAASSS